MTRSARTTSTHYAHPSRPLLGKLCNRAAVLLPTRSMSPDTLLDEAMRKTGLDDFGDAPLRTPLTKLLESIESDARLHPLGRTIMRGRILTLLENRLRIEAFVRAHPAIEDIEIRRPIVIAGLQRTGTTVLHRLIAADPRARALLGWEAVAPVPLPGEGERGSARRQRAGKLTEVGLRALAPDFFAIHPVESDAPEEDVLLLDLAFTSQAPEATLHVPTYASWLEGYDLVPSYRYLRRALQVLHWQRSGDFWVLKTPHHMEYLHELLTVFPDAVIVQTHRDPQATMPSFCSMVAHGRGIFSDDVDPREVGRHWLRKVGRMIDRSLAVRDSDAAATIVDVSYYDLVRDPLAEIQRIYDRAGLELIPQAADAMRAKSARDVQHRHGRHAYDAHDFGLSLPQVEQAFSDYRARFAIRHEKIGQSGSKDGTRTGAARYGDMPRAIFSAAIDVFSQKPGQLPLGDDIRLAGRTVLVTGANAGLGKAVAIDLARRGARLLLACRSGIPAAGREIAAAAGSTSVEMLRVDLSDMGSVVSLADTLVARRETLDAVVCNAGLMPPRSQVTKQGFEVLYAVHFLANFVLLRRLLDAGVIPNDVFSHNGRAPLDIPRIVFVCSETHRSSAGLDFDRLGGPVEYGVRDGLKHYGDSKLALVTFATELARRLMTAHGPTIGVHSLCPGPVASNIARDAPLFLQPLLRPAMRAFFASPEKAAAPVVYLTAAPELAGETGWYLHLMQRKAPSERALDPANGERLWRRAEEILQPWLGGTHMTA
jgi:NAD(P)-dependent dehydrogenase (short-subunit alcohol dehydrogenase family)